MDRTRRIFRRRNASVNIVEGIATYSIILPPRTQTRLPLSAPTRAQFLSRRDLRRRQRRRQLQAGTQRRNTSQRQPAPLARERPIPHPRNRVNQDGIENFLRIIDHRQEEDDEDVEELIQYFGGVEISADINYEGCSILEEIRAAEGVR